MLSKTSRLDLHPKRLRWLRDFGVRFRVEGLRREDEHCWARMLLYHYYRWGSSQGVT